METNNTTKNQESALRAQFAEAVVSLSKPPVLVGPNWLHRAPSGKPGHFEFVGIPRIAKALKQPPSRIHGMLMRKLRLEALGLTSEVSDQMIMKVYPAKAPDADPKAK